MNRFDRRYAVWARIISLAVMIATIPTATFAKNILVIAPHPDDEALIAAGRVRAAVNAGDTVHIVVVTNGDVNGTSYGYTREAESVAAAQVLGLPEQNVVFLGYGDASLETLWNSASGTQIYRSAAGQTATYANRGLGGVDFHRFLTGVSGPYNRNTIVDDFKSLITYFAPDEIYTLSYWDAHADHTSTARFTNEALITLKKQGVAINTAVFQTLVWPPNAGDCYSSNWPPPATDDPLPYSPFPEPPCVGPATSLDWQQVRHFPVPAEMQVPDRATNLKWRTIQAYPSADIQSYLFSFVRKEEFFWRSDYANNVALVAQVTASSERTDIDGQKEHAVDGLADANHEWRADELNGAWIQLNWPSAMSVAQVNLFDRIDTAGNMLGGRLLFSDGSTISVGALPTSGKPLAITFAPKTITWVRYVVDQAEGAFAGVSEMEVLGAPSTNTQDIPPHIVRGPFGPSVTAANQTATFSVLAHDLDADSLQYAWTADGGTISGSGPNAQFTSPTVTWDTIVTITVTVSDGRGGVASNSAFVTVTPVTVSSLALDPGVIPSGGIVQGTVTLSAPASAGGIAVPLSTSNSSAAAPPSSVSVPAGAGTGTFSFMTGTVATETVVTLSAGFGTSNQTALLTVTPPAPSTPSGVTLSPSSVVGGQPVRAVVLLSGPAPSGGLVLQLGASNPSLVSLPTSVTVQTGAMSAAVTVGTAIVSSPQSVSISATDGVTTVSAILNISQLQLAALSLSPMAVVGGSSVQGTVTLNGPTGAGGAIVALTTTDGALANPGSTVTVPAGSASATFPVATSAVASAASATIAAAFGGVQLFASLTLQPPQLSALAITPNPLIGGVTGTATVTLDGPAPTGGVSVLLQSSDPTVASVPDSVSVPAGSISANAPVSSSVVAAMSSVTVSASFVTTRTVTLTVKPVGTKSILVVAPHPDDEALIAAGRVRAAVNSGDTVHVVVVTNGDVNGTSFGYTREAESVAAAQVLGLPEQNVLFMGYGDASLETLWSSASGTQVYTSAAGQTSTYANRGLGGVDFHRFLTGASGPYNRNTIVGDFKSLVTYFQPDEIYTLSYWDGHADHASTFRFVNEALIALKKEGANVPVQLFQGIVWPPNLGSCYSSNWPGTPSNGVLPYPPFTEPPCVGLASSLDWQQVHHFPVPAEMQTPETTTNLKWRTIQAYPSTDIQSYLFSFVRKEEFFWRSDFRSNVALVAQVSASSERPDIGGQKEHAVDGLADDAHEWRADELNGAWIQLNWPSPMRVAQVNLFDRIDRAGNMLSGRLFFSDGSTIPVGALPTSGKPLPVIFSPKTVTWVRYVADQVAGAFAGVSEVEVLGAPATSMENIPPHVVTGPVPSGSAVVPPSGAATLSVVANDLDGDALQYSWTADLGTISGTGATADYTAPAVSQDTVVTVTVRVTDGRGGVTTNSAFLTVSPLTVSFSVSPATVAAGRTATGTVRLSEAAPARGVLVTLTSSDATVAAAPASITIPSGTTSANFTITTGTVAASTPTTITANFGSESRSAVLTITPPIPVSISLSPTTAVGGQTVQATVTLSAPAPTGGLGLQMTVSDSSVATVPGALTVSAGSSTAVVPVSTTAVSSTQSVVVMASVGTTSVSATLTVNRLQLSSLTLTPVAAVGGNPVQGTVTLNGPAPPGGATVLLNSSDGVGSVPASAVVPQGALSATFTVTTSAVAAPITITVTGTLGPDSRSASLIVNPPTPSGFSVSPTSVRSGATSTGTVTLNGVAPAAGLSVALTSNQASVASVPPTVTVAAGTSTATFTISTYAVSASTSVTISVTASGSTRTASLTVTPVLPLSLSLSPSSLIGGNGSVATITLNSPAPPGGMTVTLSSSNPSAATVPSNISVPAGALTSTFPITTTAVSAQTTSTIGASANGTTRTATLTVRPPTLTALALSLISVIAGTSSTATVTLGGVAPAGGFAVSLTSSNTGVATVPAAVTVPGGASTVNVTVTTLSGAGVRTATISASANGVTRSASLTVTASPAVMTLTLSPSTVRGGTASQATVTLNAPAPSGGLALTVTSSNTAVATVPTGIRVPAGASSTTFSVQSRTVTTTSSSTISATGGGVRKTAVLTVTP